MTSQLTPEQSTTRPAESPRSQTRLRDRTFLQPWFVLAVLCMIAIVVLAAFG
ncbi:MAG: hypothetical protein J2P16_12170 [Mycobacterium sp.]|nr:hypothetical protein [Mycobacterium sp.]